MQASQALNVHHRQRRQRELRGTLIYHIGVGLLGMLMLYPVVWQVASSFKAPDEEWTSVNNLIPNQFLWSNYAEGWRGFGGITFTTFYKNSFIIAGLGTLMTVVSSAVVAYGFSRIQFVGSKLWFGIMMLTLMLPAHVIIIPQYIMFANLGWVDTYLPLIVPKFLATDAFFIFMMVQFIRRIPRDLDEAAIIDGCSTFHSFRCCSRR